MKWKGGRRSSNVDDRRGMSGGKIALGGGALGIIVLLVSVFTGTDLSGILNQLPAQQSQSPQQTQVELSEAEQEMGDFVSVVLGTTEDVWGAIFSQNGMQYEQPQLVLFTGSVQSGCGGASSASGPFYCPLDKTVYMDLSFFQELKTRFGAQGGDFAIAYVIAHEVGHHVQNLLGTSGQAQKAMGNTGKTEANRISVALELQADYYAGVWAHHTQYTLEKVSLEEGDIEEALSAANAVGDDAIQKRTQGHVVPDAFTHGTSEQRVYWFSRGYKTGRMQGGNTFEELGL